VRKRSILSGALLIEVQSSKTLTKMKGRIVKASPLAIDACYDRYERESLSALKAHVLAFDTIVQWLSVGVRNGENEHDDPSDERGLDDCTNDGAVDGTTFMRIIQNCRALCGRSTNPVIVSKV
jgi:hypothetical protein